MDSGRDHGRIEPDEYGRWRWPFAHLEQWDWFTVNKAHRTLQQMRNLASTRGYQIGRKFRVTEVGDYLKVQRRGYDPRKTVAEAQDILDGAYGDGVFFRIPFDRVERPALFPFPLRGRLPAPAFFAHEYMGRSYGLTCLANGVRVEPVKDVMDWLEAQALLS